MLLYHNAFHKTSVIIILEENKVTVRPATAHVLCS